MAMQEQFDPVTLSYKVLDTINNTAKALVQKTNEFKQNESTDHIAKRLGYKRPDEDNKVIDFNTRKPVINNNENLNAKKQLLPVQDLTNMLLSKIKTSVDVLTSTFMSSFEKVAREETQSEVLHSLEDIAENNIKSTRLLEDLTGVDATHAATLMPVKTEDTEYLTEHLESIDENTSILEKIENTLVKHLTKVVDAVIGGTRIQTSFQKKLQKWEEMRRTTKLREEYNQMSRKEKVSFNANYLYDVMLPDENTMKKAIAAIASTASFFGALGGAAGNVITKVLSKIGIGAGSSITSLLSSGVLGSVVKLVTGLSKFLGGGMIVYALLGSLIDHPELLLEYGKAFMNIWEKNIVPTFKYLADLGKDLFAWAMEGDSLIKEVGYFVHKGLIWVLGTFLPELLSQIGVVIREAIEILKPIVATIGNVVGIIVDNFMESFNIISGFFGYGPYKDKSFFELMKALLINANPFLFFAKIGDAILDGIMKTGIQIGKSILTLIDNWATTIINMVWGEDYMGGMSMLEFASAQWDKLVLSIHEWFRSIIGGFIDKLTEWKDWIFGTTEKEDPASTIKEKVAGMLDAILGIFPSMQDVKNYLGTIIDDAYIPDKLKNWLKGKVVGEEVEAVKKMAERATSTVGELANQGITIIQDARNQAQNHLNNVINQGKAAIAGGRPSTRPDDSGYDRRLYGSDWGTMNL